MNRVLIALAAAGLAIPLALAGARAAGTGAGEEEEDAPAAAVAYAAAVEKVEAGDYAAAVAMLQALSQQQPDNPDVYNYLGFSHRKLGDLDAALASYDKALALRPNHLGANEYLGELYLMKGDLAKAEERLSVLEQACGGCEEHEELEEQIDAFKAQQ